jgi:hypothetical protein
MRIALGIAYVALSLIPFVIAYKRKCRNFIVIDVLAFFFTWTIIGWVVAMVWAMSGESDAEEFNRQLRGF